MKTLTYKEWLVRHNIKEEPAIWIDCPKCEPFWVKLQCDVCGGRGGYYKSPTELEYDSIRHREVQFLGKI